MPSTSPEDKAAVWEAQLGVGQVMSLSATMKSLCSSPSLYPPKSPPSPVPLVSALSCSPSLCIPSLHPPLSHSLHPLLVSASPAPRVYTLPCLPKCPPSPVPPASSFTVSLPYAPLSSFRPPPPLSLRLPYFHTVSGPICVLGGGKVVIHFRVLTLQTTHCVGLEFKVKLNIHLPCGDAP